MIEKYGKSFCGLKKHKQSFFKDNDELLKSKERCAELYSKQPLRHMCKTCGESLESGAKYQSHGVEYIVCSNCSHVNGRHEETEAYSNYLYMESNYGSYIYGGSGQKIYDQRVKDIYLPKAKFLLDVLENHENISRENISILDIGAGSGYFLSACDDLEIPAYGVDMSMDQVEFGNMYMHKTQESTELSLIKADSLAQYITNTSVNVVSAIGVMEHVLDFHTLFESICDNTNIQYIYMSVPMFGLSNVLEAFTPDVYNRHLGGEHTHVFSDESLRFLCDKYKMEMVAKWRFGTDMMDLFRICMVKLPEEFNVTYMEKFQNCLDEMQRVLDKNDFSSEIHLVLKKK